MITSLLRRLGEPVEAPPSFPHDVTLLRNAWIPGLGGRLARMRGPAAAVTLGRVILLHPAAPATPRLLRHELAHVRQWQAAPFSFPFRYIWQHLRHGYHDNPYEVDARLAENGRAPT